MAMFATAKAPALLLGLLRSHPWIGWAGWALFVAAALARMHPRRFAAAFQFYLDFAAKLWAEQPIYDPASLGEVSYWPSSLLLFVPLLPLDPVAAGLVALSIFAALFTWAAVALTRALLDDRPDALWLAGFLLIINIPAAWYHVKQVQLHIPMTAAMMLAAAAMMRARSTQAALWLVLALIAKPISLVMVLLAGALAPRTRPILLAGIIFGFALPFAFLRADYLVAQYQLFAQKLWAVAAAPPAAWIYQADFTTLLRALGIVLPGPVSLGVRLLAAIGTLALAWRVQRSGGAKSFALALLLLAGLYITLFGPRNENVSFLVVTPAIAALALLILLRNEADPRGWLLIGACVALGFVVSPLVDGVVKPAIILAIYLWVAWLMAAPQRWRRCVEISTDSTPLKVN
jgi:hypothetical protein